jgi:hypothetical protein
VEEFATTICALRTQLGIRNPAPKANSQDPPVAITALNGDMGHVHAPDFTNRITSSL